MGTVRATAFDLPLPPGWADRTAVTVAGPRAQDGYVPNLVVTHDPLCDGMGLHGFAEGHANLMQLHASEFAVLSREECELAGERALMRIVRWRMGDEPTLVQLQAFVVRGGVGYALVGTATEDAFADAEPQLRAMIDGFRFAPAPAAVGAA
jgi:hypothetical protein